MHVMRTCTECGTTVPQDAPFGHCPNCLLQLAFRSPLAALVPSEATRFGDYELLEPIGRGGMGVVYKARQVSLNRLVALKMLNPQCSAFPAIAERIRIEAEAAGSLHHPNIVTIHEVSQHEGQPFYVMEMIDGSGMDQLIGTGGFDLATVDPSQHYAHRHGVLHRDLKPANVVIDATGEPYLTDFGLAKIVGRELGLATGSGSVYGTLAYMAPEQASADARRASTAADVYSLGATFYAMLTGHAPFRGATPTDTLRQVREAKPEHPSACNAAVDRELAAICLKCLEKDPERRYHSARALAEDLERWLRREPTEVWPVRRWGRIWRWCRREPQLAGLTMGLFLLVTAIAVLASILYRHERFRRTESERMKREQQRALATRMETEMSTEGQDGFSITAEELAAFGDRAIIVEPTATGVTLASRTGRMAPDRMVKPYKRFVDYLQPNLAKRVSPPVLFDLRLSFSYPNVLAGLLEGKADLMRSDPAGYVLARQEDPGMRLLVQEASDGKPALWGAIFTRADSRITNLTDLKGYSFVFGELGSALGDYLPRSALVEADLRARDFLRTTNLSSTKVVTAVRTRTYDAGAAEWHDLEDIKAGMPLRILKEFRSPSQTWMARKELDDSLIAAMQECFFSLHDSNVLAGLDPRLTGFLPARPADYDALEQEMERAKRFDEP
jgi:ABC-type phosphate/phosphonate transport system substrate-binding protein